MLPTVDVITSSERISAATLLLASSSRERIMNRHIPHQTAAAFIASSSRRVESRRASEGEGEGMISEVTEPSSRPIRFLKKPSSGPVRFHKNNVEALWDPILDSQCQCL